MFSGYNSSGYSLFQKMRFNPHRKIREDIWGIPKVDEVIEEPEETIIRIVDLKPFIRFEFSPNLKKIFLNFLWFSQIFPNF